MAITSGFYNSSNGDRKYSAEQFNSLFAGIITDGVFPNYPEQGNQFVVSSVSGMTVKVGPGKGWFKNTWIENDADVEYTCANASPSYPRIDSLFIKIDKRSEGRVNTIVLDTGSASSNPVAPSHSNTSTVFWYRLANISIPAGATSVGTITNFVGTSLPIITAPLDKISAAGVLAGWKEEVDSVAQTEIDAFLNNQNSVLSSLIRVIPAIWLCDHDVPTTNGTSQSYSRAADTRAGTAVNFYPDFYNDQTVHARNTPKVGDIVLGSNGYYGKVTYANVGSNYFSITVQGLGETILNDIPEDAAKVFEFTFSGIDPSNTVPRSAYSPDVSCSSTFSQIAEKYNDGYILKAKVLIEHNRWQAPHTPLEEDKYTYVPIEPIMNDGNFVGLKVRTINHWAQIEGSIDAFGYEYGYGTELRGWYDHLYEQNMNYVLDLIPVATSVNSSTGLVSFVNRNGDTLFPLQLPLYNGSTDVTPK